MGKNIDARNKFVTGLLCAIPSALIGGVGGAIASIGLGTYEAYQSKAKQRYAESDECKRKYYSGYDINKARCDALQQRRLLKQNGEKYACMTETECKAYLAKIRENYPMLISCDDLRCPVFDSETYVNVYNTKNTYVFDEEGNKNDYSFVCHGMLCQDLVRRLDEAIEDGRRIELIEVKYKKMHPAVPKYGIKKPYETDEKEYYYGIQEKGGGLGVYNYPFFD